MVVVVFFARLCLYGLYLSEESLVNYETLSLLRLRFMSVEMDSSSFIQFDVPEYSSTVLSQLNELRLQGKLCDIIVHIQGQPFRAHKAVLAASSPYWCFSGT